MLGKTEGRRRRGQQRMDGWMASLTQWTWVWKISGSGDGQGGLVCCDSWGRKELDTTERLNWTEENRMCLSNITCLCSDDWLLLLISEEKTKRQLDIAVALPSTVVNPSISCKSDLQTTISHCLFPPLHFSFSPSECQVLETITFKSNSTGMSETGEEN